MRYLSNRKALIQWNIFEEKLRNFDHQMKTEGWKVCLVVYNCSADPKLELENTELVFLPPNTTSHIPPMESGIIKNFRLF